MFCVACTEPVPPKVAMSFKCDDETFAELIEVKASFPHRIWRSQVGGARAFDTLRPRADAAWCGALRDRAAKSCRQESEDTKREKKEENEEERKHEEDGGRKIGLLPGNP